MGVYEISGITDEVRQGVNLLKSGTPIVFFDFETTGKNAKTALIVQIGAIKAVMKNGILEVIDSFNELVDPQVHIPEEASEKNNITDDMVKGHMLEEEAYNKFREFIGPMPLICGYNSIKYDQVLLNRLYLKYTGTEFVPLLHIDVKKMAQAKLSMEHYTLQLVAEKLGCNIGIQFHDALSDVMATVRVFQELYPLFAKRNAILPRLPVQNISYFCPKYTIERVYVFTYPKTKSYYDAYQKKWVSDMDIDLRSLRNDTFEFCHVANEKELLAYAKMKKNTK